MLYSDQYKFIFIHIPKTGGSSIRRVLKDNIEDATRINGGTHTTIEEVRDGIKDYDGKFILAKNGLPREKYDEYTKFTFVRNPWDRAVSLVADDLRKIGKLITKEIFYKRLIEMDESRLNSMRLISIDRLLEMDYVYSFENLQKDFKQLLQRIGLHCIELPHVRETKHIHYSAYYNIDTMVKVRECEKDLIDYYGYEFAGSTYYV